MSEIISALRTFAHGRLTHEPGSRIRTKPDSLGPKAASTPDFPRPEILKDEVRRFDRTFGLVGFTYGRSSQPNTENLCLFTSRPERENSSPTGATPNVEETNEVGPLSEFAEWASFRLRCWNKAINIRLTFGVLGADDSNTWYLDGSECHYANDIEAMVKRRPLFRVDESSGNFRRVSRRWFDNATGC
jgi:hypothetical protein